MPVINNGHNHTAIRYSKSLETHVFPFIGNRNITTLNTPDLLIPVRAAEAKQIYEIASRLQQRISAVMRYAVQSGIIRYNPALDMAGALTSVKRQHRPLLLIFHVCLNFCRVLTVIKVSLSPGFAVMLNLLVLFAPVNSDMPAGLKLILTIQCGLFQPNANLCRGKILTPGLQDANTTSCATQQTGCSHTDRTSDMGW